MKLSLNELQELVRQYVVANKVSTDTFSVTKDNIAGLVDTIGKIFTLDTNFSDKLAIFDGEYLAYGKSIEEWQQDLILPVNYDDTGANALAPNDPTYRPVSYSFTLGRKVLPTTVRNNNLERCVHNEGEFSALTAMILKRLYDSETAFKFDCKKEILAKLISACDTAMSTTTVWANNTAYAVNTILKKSQDDTERAIVVKKIASADALTYATALAGGYIIELDLEQTLAKPTDTASSEAFITQVKQDVESASFISEGHSLNGNTLGASDAGLALIIKKGIMPVMEVEAMAGAFHENKLAIPAQVIVVDNFGSDTTGAYAMLVDVRGIKLHNTYKAVRTQENGKGDFMNYFLHTENTGCYSRNTFVKVYKA